MFIIIGKITGGNFICYEVVQSLFWRLPCVFMIFLIFFELSLFDFSIAGPLILLSLFLTPRFFFFLFFLSFFLFFFRLNFFSSSLGSKYSSRLRYWNQLRKLIFLISIKIIKLWVAAIFLNILTLFCMLGVGILNIPLSGHMKTFGCSLLMHSL